MTAWPIVDIGDDNWKSEVLDAQVPVLVDFWAEWCGPCKQLTPVLEKAVRASKGAEATPAEWQPGKKTLKPGPDLVGKVWEVWKTKMAFD